MDIDKIILKSLNQEASLKEYEQLEMWKQESQENLDFINSIMENNNTTPYKQFDKNEAWETVEQKMAPPKSSSILKYLIGLLLIGFIAFGVYKFIGVEKRVDEFKTEENIDNIQLADNSNIWLNQSSTLAVDPDFSTARKVSLDGEAFFEIEADKSNPFVIGLGNDEFIKVVGTSFNVVNNNDNFDLTVYSGVVELHAQNRVLVLNKKDRVTRVNGSLTKYKDTNPNILSWKNKELVFEGTSLELVFKDLAKHYKVDIELSDDLNFTNCALRNRFKNQNIDEVMAELKDMFNLKYTKEDATFKITELNCE